MSEMKGRVFRCGVIGYSGAFRMGNMHLQSMEMNRRMTAAAVCELDEDLLALAAEEWPGIGTYRRVGDMLRRADLDLVAIITPHNTHGKLALQCLKAGVGVVVEKPMAVTTKEIKAIIAMAKRRRVMLSTFHNRRWDGDFMVLRDLVRKEKIIGRVFKVEAHMGGYREQGGWWRSDRKISGGAIYDWGAHFMDWILNIISEDMEWVSGYQVKNRAWRSYTNEDHSEVTVKFKGGCISHLTITNMSMDQRPRWRVLGDRGSIVAGDGAFEVNSLVNGRQMTTTVPYGQQDHHAFYANVCRHLQGRARLAVTAESAARVIAVLEAANRSAARGRPGQLDENHYRRNATDSTRPPFDPRVSRPRPHRRWHHRARRGSR